MYDFDDATDNLTPGRCDSHPGAIYDIPQGIVARVMNVVEAERAARVEQLRKRYEAGRPLFPKGECFAFDFSASAGPDDDDEDDDDLE